MTEARLVTDGLAAIVDHEQRQRQHDGTPYCVCGTWEWRGTQAGLRDGWLEHLALCLTAAGYTLIPAAAPAEGLLRRGARLVTREQLAAALVSALSREVGYVAPHNTIERVVGTAWDALPAAAPAEGLRHAADTLMVALNRWERAWQTTKTGYGDVAAAKERVRAALARHESGSE